MVIRIGNKEKPFVAKVFGFLLVSFLDNKTSPEEAHCRIYEKYLGIFLIGFFSYNRQNPHFYSA